MPMCGARSIRVLLLTVCALACCCCCEAVRLGKQSFPQVSRWKWDNPEHNRKRRQSLLKWANKRDEDRAEESLLQIAGKAKQKVSLGEERLTRWRQRLHERMDAEQEHTRRTTSRKRAINSLQVGIAQRHDRMAPSPDLKRVAEAYGAEDILKNARSVAEVIRRSSKSRRRAAKSNGAEETSSFVEISETHSIKKSGQPGGTFGESPILGEPGRGHPVLPLEAYSKSGSTSASDVSANEMSANNTADAMNIATTEATAEDDSEDGSSKAGVKELASALFGDFGSVPAAGDPVKCIMCLYLMEMTERDVGFPQRDFYSDVYPSYSSRNQGRPGPASYFRNFGGSVSQPPGSYNPIPGPGYSFLEVTEKTKDPVGAWKNYGDFSTISSPEQNLRTRVLAEKAALAAHEEALRVGEPPKTDMYTLYQDAFENSYATTKALRSGARSEVMSLNSGSVDYSLLETSESSSTEKSVDHDVVPTAFVETKFAGSLASAMGLTLCRPGKKYCRPRIKQPGRRQLERRVMMQAIKSEYAEMEGLMRRSMMDTCENMPKDFRLNCQSMMGADLKEIAEKYLHDYDDDEICTDLKYCTIKQLNVPQEPYVLKVPIP